MERVTLRLPSDLIRAYDRADGNRSALMRRRLSEAVEEGELTSVPGDLLVLAEREAIVDRGRLDRKRATFKTRAHDFFSGRWETGGVTPDDVDTLADSWRHEGTLFGAEHVAFVEEIVEWWSVNYDPISRPDMPGAGHFVARLEPDSVDIADRLVETIDDARADGLTRATVEDRLGKYHPPARVSWAADQVFGETA
jgi:hypothetical protein